MSVIFLTGGSSGIGLAMAEKQREQRAPEGAALLRDTVARLTGSPE